MTDDQINYESDRLARVVIRSLKDESRISSWLEVNRDYYPEGNGVMATAIRKIKIKLKRKGFS